MFSPPSSQFSPAPAFTHLRTALHTRATPGLQPLDELVARGVIAPLGGRHHEPVTHLGRGFRRPRFSDTKIGATEPRIAQVLGPQFWIIYTGFLP